MRYLIIVVAILALSFGGFYYLKSKNIVHFTPSVSKATSQDVPKATKSAEPSQLKSAKEVNSDPLDQIKKSGEEMQRLMGMFAEMNDVLEEVKNTVQGKAIEDK